MGAYLESWWWYFLKAKKRSYTWWLRWDWYFPFDSAMAFETFAALARALFRTSEIMSLAIRPPKLSPFGNLPWFNRPWSHQLHWTGSNEFFTRKTEKYVHVGAQFSRAFHGLFTHFHGLFTAFSHIFTRKVFLRVHTNLSNYRALPQVSLRNPPKEWIIIWSHISIYNIYIYIASGIYRL